ncbi:MAG: LytR/AlgR family response regulator transcription factor [Marinicella sp.]
MSVVLFETAQQLFYMDLYQISPDAKFNDIFFSQFRKWTVWVIFAIPLWFYIKELAQQDWINAKNIYHTVALIIVILIFVMLTMSVIEINIAELPFNATRFWEYVTFYVYQKTPIYTFGYTFLSIVFYLYIKNNQLAVQVLKLSQLNQKELHQFYKNRVKQEPNTTVLKIKVGNHYKIISIEDIDWIEADDYCVNIHSNKNEAVYSMRATLKSLENILPDSFLRVHRSAIVNMTGVEEYKTKGSGLITMKSGDEIAVAQSKLKLINDFFGKEG